MLEAGGESQEEEERTEVYVFCTCCLKNLQKQLVSEPTGLCNPVRSSCRSWWSDAGRVCWPSLRRKSWSDQVRSRAQRFATFQREKLKKNKKNNTKQLDPDTFVIFKSLFSLFFPQLGTEASQVQHTSDRKTFLPSWVSRWKVKRNPDEILHLWHLLVQVT